MLQLWQRGILNLPKEARDWTRFLTDTSWVLNPLSHNGNSTVFKLLNNRGFIVFLCVTELDEVSSKVNSKKSKRSANDFDFAGSFQGKKMYLVFYLSIVHVQIVVDSEVLED